MSIEQLVTNFINTKNTIYLQALMVKVNTPIQFTFYSETDNILVVCTKSNNEIVVNVSRSTSTSTFGKGCECVIREHHTPKIENRPLDFSHLIWDDQNFIDSSYVGNRRYYIQHTQDSIIINTYDDEWNQDNVETTFLLENKQCTVDYKGEIIKTFPSNVFTIEIITKDGIKYRREYPNSKKSGIHSIFLPEDTQSSFGSSYFSVSYQGYKWMMRVLWTLIGDYESGKYGPELSELFPTSISELNIIDNDDVTPHVMVTTKKEDNSIYSLFASYIHENKIYNKSHVEMNKCLLELAFEDYPDTFPIPDRVYTEIIKESRGTDVFYYYDITDEMKSKTIQELITPYLFKCGLTKLKLFYDHVVYVTGKTVYWVKKNVDYTTSYNIGYVEYFEVANKGDVQPGIYCMILKRQFWSHIDVVGRDERA